MELVGRAIDFLQGHPVVALAIGIALLLVLLYKHPVIFFIVAVLAVVIYMVLNLSSVGVSEKEGMIEKSVVPSETFPAHLPRVLNIVKIETLF